MTNQYLLLTLLVPSKGSITDNNNETLSSTAFSLSPSPTVQPTEIYPTPSPTSRYNRYNWAKYAESFSPRIVVQLVVTISIFVCGLVYVLKRNSRSRDLQNVRTTIAERRRQSQPRSEAELTARNEMMDQKFYFRKVTEKDQEENESEGKETDNDEKIQISATDDCCICLNNYQPGEIVCVAKTNLCGHVFHQDCVNEWLKQNDDCPLCRVDLMN
jgi:hypothetical protein